MPEPNSFTPSQFGVWRGLLRIHSTIFRALDRALLADHGVGIDAYGVLITLVSAPGGALPIGALGEQRNLSPSGVSRSVDRLAKVGLVERRANPDDGRSLLVGLTPEGLARLRAAQVTHHAVVRELLLDRLDEQDVQRLGELWEKAMPGSLSSASLAAVENARAASRISGGRCRTDTDSAQVGVIPSIGRAFSPSQDRCCGCRAPAVIGVSTQTSYTPGRPILAAA